MQETMKKMLTSLRRILGAELAEEKSDTGKGGSSIVAKPRTTAHVSSIIHQAMEKGVPVIPSGSGLDEIDDVREGIIILDMSGMDKIVVLDDVSMIVTVQSGIQMKDLENYLKGRGYITGITPHPFSPSTLGGIISQGRVGPYMSELEGTGEVVVSMEAVFPNGAIMHSTATPRSATGPDIAGILTGSRGTLAIMTELTIRVCPIPESRLFTGFSFESMADGIDALRKVMRTGLRPAFLRILDQDSTRQALDDPDWAEGGVVAAFVFEGLHSTAQAQNDLCVEVCAKAGGRVIGGDPVRELWKGRNGGGLPGVDRSVKKGKRRPGIMEVRSLWPGVVPVYGWIMNAAGGALKGRAVITQASPEGAAVWFVFDDVEEGSQDRRKTGKNIRFAAAEVCDEVGASIGFHSDLGLSKNVLKKGENPELFDLYQGIRKNLDPAGILNPGGHGL